MKIKNLIRTSAILLSVMTIFYITVFSQEHNTIYGVNSGINLIPEGDYNTFFGEYAGNQNTTGERNTFLGAYAGHYNTSGIHNIFIGMNAGKYNVIGERNIFIGDESGRNHDVGSRNIGIGYGTMSTAGSKDHNTSIGYQSLFLFENGINNVALGSATLANLTDGNNNTMIGRSAGARLETGGNNTFIGYATGAYTINGSGNVFLGYRAGIHETGSNKLYVTNGSNDGNIMLYGDFATQQLAIGTKNIPTNIQTSQGASYALFVPRGILTDEVKVKTGWADYVFEENFELPSIEEEIAFIDKNGHLMSFPSAKEIDEDGGVNVGEMMVVQQEMIEKLMLYVAELKGEIEGMKK